MQVHINRGLFCQPPVDVADEDKEATIKSDPSQTLDLMTLFFRQPFKIVFDLLDRLARGGVGNFLELAGAFILDYHAIKDGVGSSGGKGILRTGQRSVTDLLAKLH